MSARGRNHWIPTEQHRFELTNASWERVVELLEREPKVPSGLRDLFGKPSAFRSTR
jgi:uncharacterized protein (DUF1778 family)